TIYGVETGPHPYRHPKSGTKTSPPIELVYCRECGAQMPLRMATLDHQQPKSNSANDALCRFFRALGLTKAGAAGRKTRSFSQHYAASVGGIDTPTGAAEDRYILNEPGRIYYSLLACLPDYTNTMADRCLHSIFNLRPACLPCNSSLRNTNAGWF